MSENVFIVMFGGGFVVALVAIIADSIRKAKERESMEETKREIAGHVAEGAISPADGERLISAAGQRKPKL